MQYGFFWVMSKINKLITIKIRFRWEYVCEYGKD